MAEQIFAWSKDVNLRRFVEAFQHRFPVVVKTTCAYTGADSDLHEIGCGEVYWIFEVQRQQRVVAKDYISRYVSIPVESDFRFQQQRRDTLPLSRPMTLAEVIATGSWGQQIVFEGNQTVTFVLDDDSKSTTQFGVIEVMGSYDEKYLLGRLIHDSGQLCANVVAIPVYIPIRLSVAQSLKDGDDDYFRSWKQVLAEEGSSSSYQVALSKDILIFEELPTDYCEDIKPSGFVKTQTGSANEQKKQSPRPLSVKCKEYIPVETSQVGGSSSKSVSNPRRVNYVNVTLTHHYENTPFIASNTEQRDKPAPSRRVTFKQPPPPPPKKKLSAPIIRETTSPRDTEPSVPNPEKPRLMKQQSKAAFETWTCLQDVPRDVDVSSLTVDAVVRCIRLLGFDDKAEVFKREDVDGQLLRKLDENTLITDFGFRSIDAKKILLFAEKGWQPNLT